MLRNFTLAALLALAFLSAPSSEAATTGDVKVTVRVNELGSADLGTPSMVHLLDYSKALTSGTSANMADLVWSDERSVTSGTPDDIDLAGSLSGALGGTLTLLKPVGICIWNKSTTSGQYLTVGADGTAPFYSGYVGGATHTRIVQPNGMDCWFSPIDAGAVTATTADILQVAAATSTISYRIIVWARSA